MGEWILILALNIASAPGDLRDVSLTTVGGFTSKASGDAASQMMTSRSIAVVGQARMQAGLQGNGNRSTPVLNYECAFINK